MSQTDGIPSQVVAPRTAAPHTMPPKPEFPLQPDRTESARLRRLWDSDVEFHAVQPALAKIRYITLSVWMLPPIIAGAVWLWLTWARILWVSLVAVGILAILVGLYLWGIWLIGRQVNALGWGLTDRDLHIRRGIMFAELTVVPLERLQYVELNQGPLARAFGLAEIQLHTASASTDASIPGLELSVATHLRQVLNAHHGVELSGI